MALELIEATGDVQLELLQRADVDAGFLLHAPGFAPAGSASFTICAEPLLIALPQAHPLAQQQQQVVALERLLDEPLVLFPRRILPSVHDAIFALYSAAGRSPEVAQEAIQMQTIVNLVAAGLGLAWVPESVREFQRSGVSYRQIDPTRRLRVPTCETSLVWREASMTPTLERFVAFAKAQSAPC